MLGPWERVLTPEGDEHRFADACFALSSGTRMAVLRVLLHAQEPLHIREIARRVGTDASPVRTHLDLLAKTGLARELPEMGRERRFVRDVGALRLIMTPPDRPAEVDHDLEPSRAIYKLTDKMRAIEEKIHKLERQHAELADERLAVWRDLQRAAAQP